LVHNGNGYGRSWIWFILHDKGTVSSWLKRCTASNIHQRYIYPIIAPPTEPQLEKDKKAIDDSFDKAFALLDQLSKDTETLKSSEQARTERLDTALSEVETVIAELKTLSKRREEESRRISDEVRGLQDLIPKAMDGQKESTDSRLRELNTELKSLKTLMSQRMSPPSQSSTAPLPSLGRTLGSTSPSGTSSTNTTNGTNSTDNLTPKPASVSNDTESTFAPVGRTATPFGTGAPGRAAIPSWQMAAANKSSSTASTSTPDNGSKDANGSA
jgi:peroxin-14